MQEQRRLTELQHVVLEVDRLGLTVRDSIRLSSARVGFFVGQQKYLEELDKARALIGADGGDTAS